MKSQIHEIQKSNFKSLSKKVLLMAALFLGTTVMVNAQADAKTAPAKEMKAKHHRKHKAEKKAEAATEAAKK